MTTTQNPPAETNARRELLHDLAMSLNDSSRGGVTTRWDEASRCVISYAYVGIDAWRTAAERVPFSDAALRFTIEHDKHNRGGVRAAGYLLEILTDPAQRRQAHDAGQYYCNRGLADRFADGVRMAARDLATGRGLYEHPEDRMRREDPEFARLQDQILFAEAVRNGVI